MSKECHGGKFTLPSGIDIANETLFVEDLILDTSISRHD